MRHHAQRPFDQEIRRRLFQDRRERRAAAAVEFIQAMLLSAVLVSLLTWIVIKVFP